MMAPGGGAETSGLKPEVRGAKVATHRSDDDER